MKNLKRIKNILKILILICIVMFVKSTIVKAQTTKYVYDGSTLTGFSRNDLHNSVDDATKSEGVYYCANKQYAYAISGEKLYKLCETTITSDDPNEELRRLAWILWQGHTQGGGGFNKYGPYQVALWFWYNKWDEFNPSVLEGLSETTKSYFSTPCALPTENGSYNQHYWEGKNIFEASKNGAKSPISYSDGNAEIKIENFTMTDGEEIGGFHITKLVGKVNSVIVTWNNGSTETIDTNNENARYFELSSGDKTGIDALTNGADVKIINKKSSRIKNLKVNVGSSASGYKVVITRYYNDLNGHQDLLHVKCEAGKENEKNCTLTPNYKVVSLKINKKDADTDLNKTEARFMLYAEKVEGQRDGWVAINKISKWEVSRYGANIEDFWGNSTNKNVYLNQYGTEITGLKTGTYHIYEVIPPKDYSLKGQKGYMQNYAVDDIELEGARKIYKYNEKNSEEEIEFVYNGYVNIDREKGTYTVWTQEQDKEKTTSNNTIEISIYNKLPSLNIIKTNENNKEKNLTGAKFIIYAVLDNGDYGWLDKENKLKHSMGPTSNWDTCKHSAGLISSLQYGKYYIYEIEAPTGLSLEDQSHASGLENAEGFASVANSFHKFIYCGFANVDKDEKNIIEFEVKIPNKDGSININKIDKTTGNSLIAESEIVAKEKEIQELQTEMDDLIEKIKKADYFSKKLAMYIIPNNKTEEGINNTKQEIWEWIIGKKDENNQIVEEGWNDEWFEGWNDEWLNDKKATETYKECFVRKLNERMEQSDFYAVIGLQEVVSKCKDRLKNVQVQLNKTKRELSDGYEVMKRNIPDNAKFMICTGTNEKDVKWVTGWASYQKNYGDFEEATKRYVYTVDETTGTEIPLDLAKGEFYPGEAIEHLKYGTYYIYEVRTPEINGIKYSMENQEGHPNGEITTEKYGIGAKVLEEKLGTNWAYCGSVVINDENNDENGKPSDLKVEYKGDDKNDATVTIPNTKETYTSLMIEKVREDNEAMLIGGKFKIYAEGEGWVQGETLKEKTYNKDAEWKLSAGKATQYPSYTKILGLKKGTYHVFETEAPEGYTLDDQKEEEKPNNIPSPVKENNAKGEPKYVGSIEIDPDKKDTQSVGYKMKVTNRKLTKLQIIKIDADTKDKLEGGQFKIYATEKEGKTEKAKGWVQGDDEEDKIYNLNSKKTSTEKATSYTSYKDITKLEKGTYYVFETVAPDGYKLEDQEAKAPPEGIPYPVKEKDAEEAPIYVGSIEIDPYNEKYTQSVGYKMTVTNTPPPKPVTIEGFVWEDIGNGKEVGQFNSLYDNYIESIKKGEEKIGGIKVLLKNSNNETIATTYTFEKDNEEKNEVKGHYRFTQKDNEEKIYYKELKGAYVEFIYNNKNLYTDENNGVIGEDATVNDWGYVIVDPFAKDNEPGVNYSPRNSKAKEASIDKKKLDDRNLTGLEEDYPGRARTGDQNYLDGEYLMKMIDEKDYIVKNINLGLKKQIDPEFYVDEYMEKVEFVVNGFNHEYKVGPTATGNGNTENGVAQPSMNIQIPDSKYYYNTPVYPSDIVQYKLESTEDNKTMRAFVYYTIAITDNEKTNKPDLYEEVQLKIDSLVNEYDSTKLTLCEEGGWQYDNNTGTATFTIEGSTLATGIERESTKTVPIKFEINQDELLRIINMKEEDRIKEEWSTKAKAQGYHEYLRTDNTWDSKAIAYYGTSQSEGYIVGEAKRIANAGSNSDKQYYLHRTMSRIKTAKDVSLKFDIPEERTISGRVFKDTAIKNGLGDGKLTNESQFVKDVKVELLDANTNPLEVAKLYPVELLKNAKYENNKVNITGEPAVAETTSDKDGNYKFVGVVPGYYYIRFTYGDGNQILCDSEGKPISNGEIYSYDYKSTIINTSDTNVIRDAKENGLDKEWYKVFEEIGTNYSTATDDLTSRKVFDGYEYCGDADKDPLETKVVDSSDKEVSPYPPAVFAETPAIGITIENKKERETLISEPEYNEDGTLKTAYTFYAIPKFAGFNFGIIEQPETKIDVEKVITNVDFTTTVGTVLVTSNPTKPVKYMSDLDGLDLANGSKYVKLEMESSYIHGADVIATYEITITNNSDEDYIELSGNPIGNYYKYGTKAGTRPKQVTIKKVTDELDKKYTKVIGINGEEITKSGINNNGITITKSDKDNTLTMTGWTKVARKESVITSYKAETTLSTLADDKDYHNKVKVTRIKLDELSTLRTGFEWKKDETLLTVIPPTGKANNNIYLVAGAIGLVVIAIGIIVIKKKVLE